MGILVIHLLTLLEIISFLPKKGNHVHNIVALKKASEILEEDPEKMTSNGQANGRNRSTDRAEGRTFGATPD